MTDEIVIVSFEEDKTPVVCPFIPILRLWGPEAKKLGYVDDKYKFEMGSGIKRKDIR